MVKSVNGRIYKDPEMPWFYGITVGMPAVFAALFIVIGQWEAAAVATVVTTGFAVFGWPLTAHVSREGEVLFRGLVRRTRLTPNTLRTMRAIGVHDYRAHLVLRRRFGLPIGYRCTKFTHADELAAAVLLIVEAAPNANVSDEAMSLLRRTALPHGER
jgi:hypothetical protein